MADHTAPDYYEQVTKEAHEAIARQDERIREAVDERIASQYESLRRALAREFGRAAVRAVKLDEIEDILYSVAHDAAREVRDIMIDEHYQESRKSAGVMIEAVFAGMELQKPAG